MLLTHSLVTGKQQRLKTAALNGIGFLSFRVITDKADENASEDYKANLNRSLRILANFLKTFIHEGLAYRVITANYHPSKNVTA
jgi:aminopeptidase C